MADTDAELRAMLRAKESELILFRIKWRGVAAVAAGLLLMLAIILARHHD